MKVTELEHEEKLALIGLVRLMIRLDGQFSEEERVKLDGLVDELGEDAFWALAEETGEKMQDEEAVKYYAQRVGRKEAQELIFGIVFDLAVPGSIVASEAELLEWLEGAWGLALPDTP